MLILPEKEIQSPSGTSATAVKKDLEPQVGVDIEVAGSGEQVVRNADLVVTVTTAKEPIIKPEWLAPGAPQEPKIFVPPQPIGFAR